MLWIASFVLIAVACGRLHSQSLDRYEQRLKEQWGPGWKRTEIGK
jgi:hypothetical protein